MVATTATISAQQADSLLGESRTMVGTIEEAMLGDEEDDSQGVSSTLVLSNDVFTETASYQLSQFFFRPRGYENRYDRTFLNGIEFNEGWRGVFNYASLGALNDFSRNGTVSLGLSPTDFAFTGIGGAENINLRASAFQRGSKITLSLTNRNYYARGMFSWATGMMDNGWAFAATVGGRYSHEGSIEGVFYRNIAGAFAVEKQIGRHSFSLTAFASPVERGQQGSSYQEVYDLVGDNRYNPNWGWQNGKKRNARVVTAFDPTAILSHTFKIADNTTLNSGLSFHYGRYGSTALNWFNAPEPRPDYYRYLPSWNDDNPEVWQHYVDAWRSKDSHVTQIDWDALYRHNYLAMQNGDDSYYMVEERRSDIAEAAFNSVLNHNAGWGRFTAGVSYKNSTSHQFKTADDLMGMKYIVDYDTFAERDNLGEAKNNDMNNLDRKVEVGDTFGYDFRVRMNNARLFAQNQHLLPRWDIFYGATAAMVDVQREGMMRNGRFPDNSFGRGTKHTFVEMGAKAGANWKISGRHILSLSALAQSEAPSMDDIYVSSRVSDNVSVEPEVGKVFSAELAYNFSTPRLRGRVSLYATQFSGQRERYGYYNDLERTFTNHLLTGVERRHVGVEAGVSYTLDQHWSFDVAASLGDYRYSNNPMGTLNHENNQQPDKSETVYMDGFRVGATPQLAGTLGVNYFNNYWFVNLSANAAGATYVLPAPLRRVMSNYAALDPANPQSMQFVNDMFAQERYDASVTLDLSVGKIIYLANRDQLNFNLTINNITDNLGVRTGGYEQGRIETTLTDADRFPSKYYYMQGVNGFLNVSYRF